MADPSLVSIAEIGTVAMDPTVVRFPITNLRQPPNIETSGDESGSLYETHRSVRSMSPQASATTKNIADALATIGVAGICNTGDGSHVGLAFWAERMSKCSGRATGSSHSRYRYADGILRLGTLTADAKQDATVTLEHDFISAGGDTLPEILHNQALPTLPATLTYELGSCEVAGVIVTGLNRMTIDFGVAVFKRTDAGGLVPTFAAAEAIQPKVTLGFADATLIDDAKFALEGVEATHANTMLQLIKKKHGSFQEDHGDSVHPAFTMAGLVTVKEMLGGGGSGESTAEIMIEGIKGASNPLLYAHTTYTHHLAA